MSSELIDFLRARLDEDELWATEASRRGDGPAVEGGAHWRWEDPETDQLVEINPGRDEFVGGGSFRVSLRSREEWPTSSGMGPLPQFAIREAEEVPSAVGGHIARHDPARVLREVQAKRRLVDAYADLRAEKQSGAMIGDLTDEYEGVVLPALALPYADHPDYRQEWTL